METLKLNLEKMKIGEELNWKNFTIKKITEEFWNIGNLATNNIIQILLEIKCLEKKEIRKIWKGEKNVRNN